MIKLVGADYKVIFIIIFIFLMLISTVRADSSELIGDAQTGKGLYQSYSCYACHGYTGETGSGTRLIPSRFNQAGFIAYVRNPTGRPLSFGPGGKMPAYASKSVSDQNLTDIYSYLKSIPSGSPPLESIPLLSDN